MVDIRRVEWKKNTEDSHLNIGKRLVGTCACTWGELSRVPEWQKRSLPQKYPAMVRVTMVVQVERSSPSIKAVYRMIGWTVYELRPSTRMISRHRFLSLWTRFWMRWWLSSFFIRHPLLFVCSHFYPTRFPPFSFASKHEGQLRFRLDFVCSPYWRHFCVSSWSLNAGIKWSKCGWDSARPTASCKCSYKKLCGFSRFRQPRRCINSTTWRTSN